MGTSSIPLVKVMLVASMDKSNNRHEYGNHLLTSESYESIIQVSPFPVYSTVSTFMFQQDFPFQVRLPVSN